MLNVVSRRQSSLEGLLLGLAGVAAVAFTFSRVIQANASTVGFFFLLVVLGVATGAGFRAAAAVSGAAMLCFNYFFLPPIGRFTVADPENWVALFTFLLTALVASHLSDRANKQAAEARRRQQETEQLYSFSRSILLTDSARPIGTQAAQSIAQIFESPLILIYDAKSRTTFHGGPDDAPGIESRLADVVRQGVHERDPAHNIDIWPIALGGHPIGALAAKAVRISDGAIQSLLNLVAIALERVRTIEAANRAEVARESEEFKSTLLDAIAHEFKTPLTSIKAAATGLRATAQSLPPDQSELASIIEEETDRLSQLVTEAVKMAEIDAGKVKPHLEAIDLAHIAQAAKSSFEGRGAELIDIDPTAGLPIHADPALLVLACRQVLDNALKYSKPGTKVHCSFTSGNGFAQLRIADHGPGIPERDRDRIFDKFFRRSGTRTQIPGTGLGLHIAREIARIHGGDLWVDPAPNPGAVFCFQLPSAHPAS